MGGVCNARMIKAQVCCSMGCKWCMAYAYILVCYVIPRASPSELHKHPRMHTYAIHHDNPCYNIYLDVSFHLAQIIFEPDGRKCMSFIKLGVQIHCYLTR